MIKRRGTRIFALLGVLLALWNSTAPGQDSSGRSTDKYAYVDILDIGQGDSILIRSPEGKTALVDAGPSKNAAAQLLRQKGLTSLDLVVVSHHHSDHIGGMDQVIRAFKPKYFLASNSSHTTKMWLSLLQTVKDEELKAIKPTGKPRRIELGSIVLTILPQPPENQDEENDNSIGLRVEYGDFAMLMTGDSEEGARDYWLETCPELIRDCTILKLAHHGSRNGTDPRWLGLVNPEVAVVSLAAGNSYGHPHSETISMLRKAEVPLLRTDQRGTITLRSDGRQWNLITTPMARRRPSRDTDAVATSSRDDDPPASKSRSGARSRSKNRWR